MVRVADNPATTTRWSTITTGWLHYYRAMRTKSFRPVIPALLSINSVDRLRSKRASSSFNSKELVFHEKRTSMIYPFSNASNVVQIS